MLRFESGLAGSLSGSILPAPPIGVPVTPPPGTGWPAAPPGVRLSTAAPSSVGLVEHAASSAAQAMAMAVRNFFMSWSSGSIAGERAPGGLANVGGRHRQALLHAA